MKFDRQQFWTSYRDEFGRSDQQTVDAIEFLLASFEKEGAWWNSIPKIAYAFATIKHETAHTFRPITEYGGVKYFDKYDTGKLARKLGNTPEKDGDGYKYRGRGYVQLTGKSNYAKYGIASKPELALDPVKAFEIMTDGMHTGAYTGKKLSDYITNRKADYFLARRIINGTDKAAQIAGYAIQFAKILNSAATSANPSTETAVTASPVTETTDAATSPPINSNETKVIDAPAKEGSTGTVTKTVVLGVTVPPFVMVAIESIKSLIADGYLSASEIGSTVVGLIKDNYKFVFTLLIAFIGFILVKKAFKQITLWLQMWIASDPKRYDVEVQPK